MLYVDNLFILTKDSHPLFLNGLQVILFLIEQVHSEELKKTNQRFYHFFVDMFYVSEPDIFSKLGNYLKKSNLNHKFLYAKIIIFESLFRNTNENKFILMWKQVQVYIF